MKKILIIIALTAVSCSLHPALEPDSASDESTNDVTVRVSRPFTRVTGTTAEEEAAINSLQVFVFDSDGDIDAVGQGSGESLSLNVTTGKGKRLWAVANAPGLTGISSEQELRGSVSSLTDNSPGNLVMAGNTTADIISDTEISISLVRLVAKLSVRSITRNFSAPGLAARPLIIKGLYLINVPAEMRFDGDGDVSGWLNCGGFASSGADRMLSDRGLNIKLSNSATYSTAHSFYCYPNPCTTDSAEEDWCPRKTRLVLETELDGSLCYYSLTFPEIRRNCTYTVENLTLSGKGSPVPDTPYGKVSLSASLTVRNWQDGSSYTEKL